MAADVITLITDDHREMEAFFDKLRSNRRARPQTLTGLRALMIAHHRAEEECVHPVIVKAAPDERERVQHFKTEHEEAERLLAQLEGSEAESKQFDQVLGKLVDAVRAHVRIEEDEVLPALRDAVDAAELERVGERFLERKSREPQAKKRMPAQEGTKRPTPASMAGARRPAPER